MGPTRRDKNEALAQLYAQGAALELHLEHAGAIADAPRDAVERVAAEHPSEDVRAEFARELSRRAAEEVPWE